MGKMLYFVTVIGVFLQTINGQEQGMQKLEECPCANEIIEGFLYSVAKNTLEVDNGQKLRLRLWQLKNDDCSTRVFNESPKPGRIEIDMLYRGDVDILEQGEDDDQYRSDDNEEQQQGKVDFGQQFGGSDIEQDDRVGAIGPQQGVDIGEEQRVGDSGPQQGWDIGPQERLGAIGPQQGSADFGQQFGGVDFGPQQEVDIALQQGVGDVGPQQGVGNGQQPAAEDSRLPSDIDIEQLLGSLALEEVQQSLEKLQSQQGIDTAQEQAGTDTPQEQAGGDNTQEQAGVDDTQEQAGANAAQKQSELPNGSYSGTGGDSTAFTFTVDVNTGNLTESIAAAPMSKRRKRDLMPFDSVVIKIVIDFDKNPDSDVATRNDQIKFVLRKALADYWLAMAFCLLDVEQ